MLQQLRAFLTVVMLSDKILTGSATIPVKVFGGGLCLDTWDVVDDLLISVCKDVGAGMHHHTFWDD
jgi:hypothetical protein